MVISETLNYTINFILNLIKKQEPECRYRLFQDYVQGLGFVNKISS